MRRLVVLALCVAAGWTGVSAPIAAAAEPPEVFMARVLRLTVEARYAQAWALLHPGHQRLAPKERFVRCRSTDPTLARYRLVSSTFLRKRTVRIESPGVPQRTSTQVVLRFRIADVSGAHPATDAVVRAVWVERRWAWVLPDRDIPAFRAGRCPA